MPPFLFGVFVGWAKRKRAHHFFHMALTYEV
jgi:hypothetical protein